MNPARTSGAPVALGALLLLALSPIAARAIEYHINEVASLAPSPGNVTPNTIAFADPTSNGAADAQFMTFEDWVRTKPVQKQFLALYPSYTEPMVTVTADGVSKSVQEKLYMYVAQARFVVTKPARSIDLAHYATMDFMQRLDPAITHQTLAPSDIKDTANRNPARAWCEAKPNVLCIQSRYQLEGKLPLGIRLVNQLSDSRKKIAEYLDFQSELRILSPADLDQQGLVTLTGSDAPIAGAIEQSIFHVNQVMQFGKMLIVFQQDKADANRTLATAFVAIAIKSNVIENRKKYEQVPVLRNLVPAQVLMGKSSFNTGNSISSGLPNYARNEIKAVATILAQE
jgi:hypothetical protein